MFASTVGHFSLIARATQQWEYKRQKAWFLETDSQSALSDVISRHVGDARILSSITNARHHAYGGYITRIYHCLFPCVPASLSVCLCLCIIDVGLYPTLLCHTMRMKCRRTSQPMPNFPCFDLLHVCLDLLYNIVKRKVFNPFMPTIPYTGHPIWR